MDNIKIKTVSEYSLRVFRYTIFENEIDDGGKTFKTA